MIAVVGEALVDLVVQPDGDVAATLGGAPYNTARAASRLGAPVAFVGALSVDRFGSMLDAQLRADGVDTSAATRVVLPTTLAAAELDGGGAATYRFYFAGTSAPATEVAAPPDVTTWFTGGLGLVLQPMADRVVDHVESLDASQVVMVDVNCRPAVVDDAEAYRRRVERICRRADVVKVSDDDVGFLVPDLGLDAAVDHLVGLGPRAVLLTAGGGAVTVVTTVGRRTVPVAPVEVVDTIGAGDSFGGGFLAWWHLAGATTEQLGDLDVLERAVGAANAVAAIVVTRRGAVPPWRDELPADWDRGWHDG